ncbi:hypothetical protein FOG50_03624 [Hanseniaspora uvarum]|nr:hypothetical protein FOG50_03624 [Hanseniaspora uvarum]
MNKQEPKNTLKTSSRTVKKGIKVRPVFKIPPPVFQGIKNHFHCLYCKSSYKGTPKIIANHVSGHSHKQKVKVYYTNKFLALYDRSKLKKKGQFKLANDINKFENTLLNNRKLGFQFINQPGHDEENGSDMFSKLKFLAHRNYQNGIPDFILKNRAIEKNRKRLMVKNKLNERKKNKNVITNKDRQQFYEAKKLLKQLNKQNSHKKYLIKRSRRKLLKRLKSHTDENLNLNYNFGGNRRVKYNHDVKDNSLQVLNHIYKKSPNFNRLFLNASENDLDIMKIREEYISAFNENLKQRKLRSLKNKIAKVRYRIAVKRKYGKRKYNPKSKSNQPKSVSTERLFLDKFNKDFSEENLLKHLKLKLKHSSNITEKRRMKFKARSNKYKLFKEDIKAEEFVKKIQKEDNKYTNSLLLPPRTLNFNNNTLTKHQVNFDDIITFPKLSIKSKQKMGPIPSWLSDHSNNKLLNRRLMYPKVSDLNDKIPENLLNHLHKSKRLKQLIKQSLYKEQHIKSMFKYQAILWRNFKRRNSIYKLNNGLVNNKKVVKLIQAKLLGKKWFNKVYGDREGKKLKLMKLSRYKAIKDKKLKYKKTSTSKGGSKNLVLKNGKKIKVDKTSPKQGLELDTKIKVIKPIRKVVAPVKKPTSGAKSHAHKQNLSVSDRINNNLSTSSQKKVFKSYSRFEGSGSLPKPSQIVSRFENHQPTQAVLNRSIRTTMETAKPLQASRFEPNNYVRPSLNSSVEPNKSARPISNSSVGSSKSVTPIPHSRFENNRFSASPPTTSPAAARNPVMYQKPVIKTSRFEGSNQKFQPKRFIDKQSTASRYAGKKPSRFQG